MCNYGHYKRRENFDAAEIQQIFLGHKGIIHLFFWKYNGTERNITFIQNSFIVLNLHIFLYGYTTVHLVSLYLLYSIMANGHIQRVEKKDRVISASTYRNNNLHISLIFQ